MKKLHLISPVLLCTILLLNSCASSKNSISERNDDPGNSKEEENSCFVQMKDGSIKSFSSLKMVTGVFCSPHLLADNKIKINASEIKAYQNKDFYAVSQAAFETGHRSYLAVETLPGFAKRVASGKLNIYCKKYNNGARAVDEFYLQSGNDGKIFVYSKALMNELVKDNPEAAEYFKNKKVKVPLSKRLLVTASLVNNTHLQISRN